MIAGGLAMCAGPTWKEGGRGRRAAVVLAVRDLIGLGGGAARRSPAGRVRRIWTSPRAARQCEIQRRAQEVIDAAGHGDANPILLIHDVGAAAYRTPCPSDRHGRRGGRIDLAQDPERGVRIVADGDLVQRSQERYVLALVPGSVALFAALCERERCPYAVVGEITGDGRLLVTDSLLSATPVDMRSRCCWQSAARDPRGAIDTQNREPVIGWPNLSTEGYTISDSLDRCSACRRLPTSPS